MDPYATHMVATDYAITKLRDEKVSPIYGIEFGSGLYSTPQFHLLDRALTIETDREWMEKTRHLESEHHKFLFFDSDSWESELRKLDLNCDVCLVDSFDGPSREVVMRLIKGHCKIIICHDSENVFRNPLGCYPGQLEIVTSFKYIKQFEAENIITVALSDEIDLR